MSENVIPLHSGIQIPRPKEVERLKFWPSDQLREQLEALRSPTKRKRLGRDGLFLYSSAYQEVLQRKVTGIVEEGAECVSTYNHELHRIMRNNAGKVWPMQLREHIRFGSSRSGNNQLVEFYVQPHPLLEQRLRDTSFLNELGAVTVLAAISNEDIDDKQQYDEARLKLRKFIVNGRALGGPNVSDSRRLAENKDARVDRVDLVVRR